MYYLWQGIYCTYFHPDASQFLLKKTLSMYKSENLICFFFCTYISSRCESWIQTPRSRKKNLKHEWTYVNFYSHILWKSNDTKFLFIAVNICWQKKWLFALCSSTVWLFSTVDEYVLLQFSSLCDLLHCAQVWVFSPVWMSLWVLRFPAWLYDFLHSVHLCGFSPLWVSNWACVMPKCRAQHL